MAHAHDWELTARPEQLPPEGDWRTWLMMGGRGSGKTRAGAEWVHALATGDLPGLGRDGRIALVAESFGDAREVMIDGISGIMGVARDRAPDIRGDAAPAGLALGRGGADVFLRRPRKPARPAIRSRLVRRARQVAA
jgi:phage terminase large subunit-like protein